MTDNVLYFGVPGALVTLPQPRGDVETTRSRLTQEFPLGDGSYRARRSLQGSRQFQLAWERIDYATHATLLGYDQGHMGPGPFALLDPGQRNWLTVNQSSSSSLTNDTSNFTIAGSGSSIASSTLLTQGVPRSVAWSFNYSSPASGSSVLSLDPAYAGWAGVPLVNRSICFSFYLRGGGTDAVVSFTPQIVWYDTGLAVLSTTSGSLVTSSSGAWQRASVAGTPPANYAYAGFRVQYNSGASAGSIVYFSQFQAEEGTSPGTWYPGTGVFPVTVVSYNDRWPWMYPTEVRLRPTLTLREEAP